MVIRSKYFCLESPRWAQLHLTNYSIHMKTQFFLCVLGLSASLWYWRYENVSGQQGADYFTDVFVSSENRCFKLLNSVDPSVILRVLLLWKECLTHINIECPWRKERSFSVLAHLPHPYFPTLDAGLFLYCSFTKWQLHICKTLSAKLAQGQWLFH